MNTLRASATRQSDPERPAMSDDAFHDWLCNLEEDVIQGEYGYEPGEFTVYSTHWRELYDEGLTPLEAFKRALDGYANARRDEEGRKITNYARIVAEDEMAIAQYRAANKTS